MTEKPVPWLRIEAADEARCDSLKRFNAIDPEWKIAKKVMNDAEEALLDAMSASREKFPDSAYDAETSKAINDRVRTYEDAQAKYRKLDSRRRSLQDELKKLTENELRLVSETREPGIFDAGDKLGPNGWKLVKLRDLAGGPDPTKPMDKQTWASQLLESNGYHTIDEYLKGRGRLILNLVDEGEIAKPTIELFDTAIYRFLEKRNMLDKWPKDVETPSGEQMTILQAAEDVETEEKAGKAEKPQEPTEGGLKLAGGAGGPDVVPMPSLAELYPYEHQGESEFKDTIERHETTCKMHFKDSLHGSPFETSKISDKEWAEFYDVVGKTPGELMGGILGWINNGRDLSDFASGKVLNEAVDLMLWRANDMGEEIGEKTDGWTKWFCEQVVNMGGGAVAQVTKLHADLGALVASFQDEPKPKGKKKGSSKKKPVAKKKPKTATA